MDETVRKRAVVSPRDPESLNLAGSVGGRLADLQRCAIYARVSTSEQSSAPQVEQLRAHAARLGWEVPDSLVFTDNGISGIRDNRPALDRLRVAMRSGQVDTVLATKLDRLGRSVIGVLNFFEEAESAGVRIVVVDQGFDTSTPTGRLTRNLLASIAEFERELIRERRAGGVARARARGVRFGRKPTPVGPGTLERIRTMRAGGASIRTIAQYVGIARSRITRILAAVPNVPPSNQND
jgi:DNA invertase Pin-like site-specific DNA recombinase